MKIWSLLFLTACCMGCLLTEYQSTVIVQHIHSQEDTSFYYSDFKINSRTDSFKLIEIGNTFKWAGLPNLSASTQPSIRIYYSGFNELPYYISLDKNGKLSIIRLDTVALAHHIYDNKDYEYERLSPEEKQYITEYNQSDDFKYPIHRDSLDWSQNKLPSLIDSIVYHHYLTSVKYLQPAYDTIPFVITTTYTSSSLFDSICTNLEKIDFWNTRVYDDSRGAAMDGYSWTLEAKIGNQHHVAKHVNLDSSKIEIVCRKLLSQAYISKEKIY